MIFLLLLTYLTTQMQTLYDFNANSEPRSWKVVNDGVMGGLSRGKLTLTPEGIGRFAGTISLENNGGFSSMRHALPTLRIETQSAIHLKIRGDGKRYQFRIKSNRRDYYSYTSSFQTNGEWQEIVLPLTSFTPIFRGRKLALPDFDRGQLEEISILFGNKRAEDFTLELDRIWLE